MAQAGPIGKEYRLLVELELLLSPEEKCLIYSVILCGRTGRFGIEEET